MVARGEDCGKGEGLKMQRVVTEQPQGCRAQHRAQHIDTDVITTCGAGGSLNCWGDHFAKCMI